MYKGSTCTITQRGPDTFFYQDPYILMQVSTAQLLDFLIEQADTAHRRIADLKEVAVLLDKEKRKAQRPPAVKPKRYPMGALGAANAPKGTPAPIPLPDPPRKRKAANKAR